MLLPPARSFKAETVDISETGVCLTSPVELTPGTWCHLQIHMPASSDPDISVSGHVCFCVGSHGAYRVGVHCVESKALTDAVRQQDDKADLAEAEKLAAKTDKSERDASDP